MAGSPAAGTVTIDQDLVPAIQVFDGATLLPAGTGSDDFADTPQNNAIVKNFSITNTGSRYISIYAGSITVPADFSVAAWPASTVLPGASTTFSVRYDARNVGSASGTVSFRDSDLGNNPYTFQITAAATPPRPSNVSVGNLRLANDTGESDTDLATYDPTVTATVSGAFNGGYAVVQFDNGGAGAPPGQTQNITTTGTSVIYDPRISDPALVGYTGPLDLRWRIISFDTTGAEFDGDWNDFNMTLSPVPDGAHIDHAALVNDTGDSAGDRLTYDPRLTGVVNGPLLGTTADIDFTIVPGAGSPALGPASGVVSGILFAGQKFTFDPIAAYPALAGYSGPLTLEYNTVDLGASGNVVHTGDTQTFNLTLYVPTPNVSVSAFALLDDTDPGAATLSTADPRLTGTVSAVPPGETVSVEFSHHGDGVVDGSVAIAAPSLAFNYDPRASEPALQNYIGPLDLQYRTVERDTLGGKIVGPWSDFPLAMEHVTTPASIGNLQLAHVTISAGPPAVTSDATLSGVVSGTAIVAAPTVQIDTGGDGLPDGSTTAFVNGAFTIVPANLPYGNLTVNVRAVEYDAKRALYLYGAWIPISFDYEPPPAPAITSFALSHDTIPATAADVQLGDDQATAEYDDIGSRPK